MAKQTSGSKNVTRITASDGSKAKTKGQSKPAAVPKRKQPATQEEEKRGLLARFFGYFVGAWKELRQVHWPTRRATWSLTGAVLAFSAFFVVFILLLDALFKYLFESILK